VTGPEIRAARTRLGLSQADLADALSTETQQVHPRTVRRWENGERDAPPFLERALRDLERERRRRHG
jgi:transcriptional regulator with XRE-family HTH domain